MPRYFFDFRQGRQCSPDCDGNEFASVDQAYDEAYKAAEEMWGDLIGRQIDPRRCAFEVRDGERTLLFVLSFLDVLDGCDEGRPRSSFADTLRVSMAHVGHARRVSEEFQRELAATRASLEEAFALIATPV
ncbi:MAG TPA: hypothetical protein VMU22_01885 [Rhizomicrobium sp.]|nr:hypothetical protein [Rhizomicrobium sp.]